MVTTVSSWSERAADRQLTLMATLLGNCWAVHLSDGVLCRYFSNLFSCRPMLQRYSMRECLFKVKLALLCQQEAPLQWLYKCLAASRATALCDHPSLSLYCCMGQVSPGFMCHWFAVLDSLGWAYALLPAKNDSSLSWSTWKPCGEKTHPWVSCARAGTQGRRATNVQHGVECGGNHYSECQESQTAAQQKQLHGQPKAITCSAPTFSHHPSHCQRVLKE